MQLNHYIEHTALKATTTVDDIKTLCQEAIEYDIYGVCVPECYVALATNLLSKHAVRVIAVIGFPLGNQSTVVKVCEAKHAILLGASEIDMVINLGFFKSGWLDKVTQEIADVKKAIEDHTLKVILETCYLSDKEIETACSLAIKAGANFVKTSTGFGARGAKVQDIHLMKKACKGILKIKASGGIKDRTTAIALIGAGAHKIGSSSSIQLISKNILQ